MYVYLGSFHRDRMALTGGNSARRCLFICMTRSGCQNLHGTPTSRLYFARDNQRDARAQTLLGCRLCTLNVANKTRKCSVRWIDSFNYNFTLKAESGASPYGWMWELDTDCGFGAVNPSLCKQMLQENDWHTIQRTLRERICMGTGQYPRRTSRTFVANRQASQVIMVRSYMPSRQAAKNYNFIISIII